MNIFMMGADVVEFMFMIGILKYSYIFTKLSIKNRTEHSSDTVTQMHFKDHAIAVIFSLGGSAIGAFGAVNHILCQHITKTSTYWSEIATSSGIVLLAVAGILFLRHMICEETPGHPYFVREYGCPDDNSKIQMQMIRKAERGGQK